MLAIVVNEDVGCLDARFDRVTIASMLASTEVELVSILCVPSMPGVAHDNLPIVRVEVPGAGRGYKPNRKNAAEPILTENMDWVEIKFDKVDRARPFTGFPSEKK